MAARDRDKTIQVLIDPLQKPGLNFGLLAKRSKTVSKGATSTSTVVQGRTSADVRPAARKGLKRRVLAHSRANV
ncbi:hypothetical protein NKH19_27680 [Mesorhizobium sp. M1338]|uniref:hypothetical protein n=1 Tax=Mesorhizobium sp. M1338 TaxID=2957085 RepID=UPI00333BBEAD